MGDVTTNRPRRWFSKVYASMSVRMDDEGMGALRSELLAPLSGQVVEVGCGDGRNTVADTPGLRRVQRIADATIWPLIAGGCHTATDPIADLRAAGFTVDEPRRLRFPDIRITQPSTPHALGTAHAPD